jgi:hypothetical protein
MKVALLRSKKDTGLFAFTVGEAGADLPSDFAPWRQTSIRPATGARLQNSESEKNIGTEVAIALGQRPTGSDSTGTSFIDSAAYPANVDAWPMAPLVQLPCARRRHSIPLQKLQGPQPYRRRSMTWIA